MAGNTTPYLGIPWPSSGDDPWYAKFEAMINSVDLQAFRNREENSLIFTGGGDVEVVDDGAGGYDLQWSEKFYVFSHRTGLKAIDIPIGSLSFGSTSEIRSLYVIPSSWPLVDETLALQESATPPSGALILGLYNGNNQEVKFVQSRFADGAGGVAFPDDSVIVVEHGADAAENGVKLLEAYAAAKLLTPAGKSLGANNRAQVLIPYGVYDLESATLNLDTDYVDLYGLCPGAARTFGGSTFKTGAYIMGIGASVLNQTVEDVRLSNITVEQGTPSATCFMINVASYAAASRYQGLVFTSGASPNPVAVQSDTVGRIDGFWQDCVADIPGFIWQTNTAGTFFRCVGQAGSFAGNSDTGTEVDVAFTGYAQDCFAGLGSFGATMGGGNATFAGYAVRCQVSSSGFGSSFNGAGSYSVLCGGFLDDCDNGSTGGSGSFGYCDNGSAECSATIRRCRSGSSSFGAANVGNGTFSGDARDCEAGDYTFGFSYGAQGSFSGTALNCSAGDYAFGASRAPSATVAGHVATSALLTGCKATGYAFGASGPVPIGNDQFFGFARDCEVTGAGFGANGDFAGTAIRCIAAAYAFGGTGGTTSQVNKIIWECTAQETVHAIGVRSGLQIKFSRIRASDALSAAPLLITTSSSAPLIDKTEIQAATTYSMSIDSSGSQNARISFCSLSKPISINVTNLFASAPNLVDASVRN